MVTMQELNQEDVRALIESGKRVLVEFFFDNCGPCKMLKLILTDISKTAEDVEIVCVNLMDNMAFADQYEVTTAPSLLYFENGALKNRFMGIQSKSTILQLLES